MVPGFVELNPEVARWWGSGGKALSMGVNFHNDCG